MTERDRDCYARRGSKLRRVLDALADGRWHRGSELHAAFGAQGWAWDGALAQLRKKGLVIKSDPMPGRVEFRYRLDWPYLARPIRVMENPAAGEAISLPEKNWRQPALAMGAGE